MEGLGLILAKTIVLMIFKKNWALIVQVIDFRFLLDLHPFLLEVIGMNNSSSFPF